MENDQIFQVKSEVDIKFSRKGLTSDEESIFK